MSNLLLDPVIQTKIESLLGYIPSDEWLDVAWSFLKNILGYDPSFGSKLDKKYGNNSDVLYLTSRPVKTLNSVTISESVKDINDFDIKDERAVEYLTSKFYKNPVCQSVSLIGLTPRYRTDRIIVDYDAGYTAEEFPDDMLYAVIRMVTSLTQTIDKGHVEQYKIDELSYKLKSDMVFKKSIEDMLYNYI